MVDLLGKVEPAWSSGRSVALREGLARKVARRRTLLTSAVVVTALGVAGIMARLTSHAHERTTVASAPQTPQVPAESTVLVCDVPRAADPSTVTPLSPDTDLVPTGPERAYALRSGGARFVVTHDAARPFVVQAGDVVVEDVGTVFTVAYVSDAEITIAVETGEVHVKHGGVSSDVVAGGHLTVAAHDEPASDSPRGDQAREPEPRKTANPVSPRPDEAEALLHAADEARANGHPADAVLPLKQLLRDHPRDARVGLAAFTLGRLLDELGRPSEAADAFARARAAGGPMAQDALARQALACARAGDSARARTLSREYVASYPGGARVKEMARLGTSE